MKAEDNTGKLPAIRSAKGPKPHEIGAFCTCPQKKCHFSCVFAVLPLALYFCLGYIPEGLSFSKEIRGFWLWPASPFEVDRKNLGGKQNKMAAKPLSKTKIV